jgi:hypothetical protein
MVHRTFTNLIGRTSIEIIVIENKHSPLVYFRIASLFVCADHWNCDSVLTSSLQYFGMFVYTQIHSAESNILSIVTQSAEYVVGETP